MDPLTIALIQVIAGALLSYASTLAQQAFGGSKVTGYRGEFETGGTVPLSILVGTIGVPGKIEYRNTFGEVLGTPNAFATYVVSFGDVTITSLTGLFVDSQSVTLATANHNTYGYAVPEYANSGRQHLRREFFDGSQTTANAFLTGTFGGDADRPWLSDMIGRGIPYVTFTALINDNLFPDWPAYMGVFQGIKLYDPRLDTTAGGSGSQRLNDPTTWAFSDNNIVIIYNILVGISYAGTKLWGGGVRQYQLPYAVWAAAMDACDALVALDAGGTEKRFRAGREIFVNEVPADVITELLIGANARIAPAANGQFYALVGVPASADAGFTDSDVLASQSASLDLFPNIDEIINGATATYLEPLQAWELKETAPYYRSDLEALDDDRRQVQGLTLSTTFSGTQAQRILKAVVEESRRFVRHVVALPPVFGVYHVLQTLSWTSTENGYSSKLFLIVARTEDPFGNIILGLQEIDPTDHDWTAATDEQPLSFAPMTPIRPEPIPKTGWSVAPYIFPDSDGTGRRIGIEVEFAGGLQDVSAVRIQVREDFGSGNTVFDSGEQAYDINDADPVDRVITWAGILPATDYEVRGLFISPPASGRENDWSSWLAVTTADIPITDVELSASLRAFKAWMELRVRDIDEMIDLATALGGEQDIANFADRKFLLEAQDIGDAGVTASYRRAILLALGSNDSVLADNLEAIEAASGDITAAVLSRMTAFASPGGGWARYGWQVRVDRTVGFSASASLYLEAKSDGSSRVVAKASEFDIVNDIGTILAMFKTGGSFIDVARIDDADIGTAKIADLAVTTAKIALLAVKTAVIDDLTVTRLKIGTGAVTDSLSKSGSGGTLSSAPSTLTVDSGTLTVASVPMTLGGYVSWTHTSNGTVNSVTVAVAVTIGGVDVLLPGGQATKTGLVTSVAYHLEVGAVVPVLPAGTYTFKLLFINNNGGAAALSHTAVAWTLANSVAQR